MDMKCKKCGESRIKKGKIAGIAAVQSLNSKTGLGGSELILSFCEKCGNVIEMTVTDPNKIK